MAIVVSLQADVEQRLGSMAEREGLSFDEMSNKILREACGGAEPQKGRPFSSTRSASLVGGELNVRMHGIDE